MLQTLKNKAAGLASVILLICMISGGRARAQKATVWPDFGKMATVYPGLNMLNLQLAYVLDKKHGVPSEEDLNVLIKAAQGVYTIETQKEKKGGLGEIKKYKAGEKNKGEEISLDAAEKDVAEKDKKWVSESKKVLLDEIPAKVGKIAERLSEVCNNAVFEQGDAKKLNFKFLASRLLLSKFNEFITILKTDLPSAFIIGDRQKNKDWKKYNEVIDSALDQFVRNEEDVSSPGEQSKELEEPKEFKIIELDLNKAFNVGGKGGGNNCFLNASMQALSHTKLLADYVKNLSQRDAIQGLVYDYFGELKQDGNKEKSADSNNFREKITNKQFGWPLDSMAGYGQHDAHEFIGAIINKVDSDSEIFNIGMINFKKEYAVHLESESHAFKNYSYVSSSYKVDEDPVTHKSATNALSLSIVKNPSLVTNKEILSKEIQEPKKLEDCFNQYFMYPEQTDYYITGEKINRFVGFYRISKLPNILIVTLKKFTNTGEKNNKDITVPCTLDIQNEWLLSSGFDIKNKSITYNLFSVVLQSGSLLFGHYTAWAKNPNNSKWYKYDDDMVSEKEIGDVVGNDDDGMTPYVLFYEIAPQSKDSVKDFNEQSKNLLSMVNDKKKKNATFDAAEQFKEINNIPEPLKPTSQEEEDAIKKFKDKERYSEIQKIVHPLEVALRDTMISLAAVDIYKTYAIKSFTIKGRGEQKSKSFDVTKNLDAVIEKKIEDGTDRYYTKHLFFGEKKLIPEGGFEYVHNLYSLCKALNYLSTVMVALMGNDAISQDMPDALGNVIKTLKAAVSSYNSPIRKFNGWKIDSRDAYKLGLKSGSKLLKKLDTVSDVVAFIGDEENGLVGFLINGGKESESSSSGDEGEVEITEEPFFKDIDDIIAKEEKKKKSLEIAKTVDKQEGSVFSGTAIKLFLDGKWRDGMDYFLAQKNLITDFLEKQGITAEEWEGATYDEKCTTLGSYLAPIINNHLENLEMGAIISKLEINGLVIVPAFTIVSKEMLNELQNLKIYLYSKIADNPAEND